MDMRAGTPKPHADAVTLGRIVRPEGDIIPGSGFPGLLCHDPALQPHLEKPWLKAWIGRELGLPPPRRERTSGTAAVTESELALHCLLVGTSGSGKSRLAELLVGQLLARGHSLLAIEPKLDTIRQMAAQAKAAGLAPEQVTIVSPRAPGGPAGWNPFLSPLLPAENAEDFLAVVAGNATSWGPRLSDLLANVTHVVAAHRLSVFELMRCLRDPEYVEALLARPPTGRPSAAYLEAADALTHEFLTASKSVRAESAAAVTNKIRKILRGDFLKALLSARTNTLDLSGLWKRQGVVLVHLDRAGLGEEGAGFLAGMVASSLFRTSLRVAGPVPVTLALDEISTAERFVGEILEQIAVFSRSANLQLLAAAQYVGQMSGPLREALLSANVQVSFRLSPSDSRLVAASLAAGTEPSVARVRVEAHPPRRQGVPAPRSVWKHRLRDASGRPLRLDPAAWQRLRAEEMFRLPDSRGSSVDPLAALARLATRHGIPLLYVRDAYSGEPVEARRYVSGLNPAPYWIDGPQPLSLVVSFPTPRLTGTERRGEADAARAWTRTLAGMPRQHAVLRIGGREPAILRVADVPETSQADVGPYLAAALRANGQSAEEVAACANARRDAVLRLARGEGDPGAGSGTLEAPVPRAFRTRPLHPARQPTTDTDAGKPDGEQSHEQRSNAHGPDNRSGGDTASGGASPFSFDGGGFAEDGSLG